MLGQINRKNREVHIVGAGASGLFCAYALCKAGYRVAMSEASDDVGGMIKTVETPYGFAEAAANSLVWTPHLQMLCDEIGVRLIELHPSAKGKYILRDGRPRSYPLSVFESIGMLWRVCTARARSSHPDMRTWAERHLGRKAADYLIEALVAGIYASPASALSLHLAFPRLVTPVGSSLLQSMWARRHSKAAKRRVVLPENGVGSLFKNLTEYLLSQHRFELTLGSKSFSLPRSENRIVATSAPAASLILEESHPRLAELLRTIVYAPLVSVNVFVRKSDLGRVPSGLGVLIPPAEKQPVLGILYSSSSFPHRVVSQEHILLTVLLGGLTQTELVQLPEQEVNELALGVIEKIFALRGSPLCITTHQWPRAIPVYSSQLGETISSLRQELTPSLGLVLAGSFTGEVSLRGMLDKAMHLP